MKKSISLFGKKVRNQRPDDDIIDLDLDYDDDAEYGDSDYADDDDYVGENVEPAVEDEEEDSDEEFEREYGGEEESVDEEADNLECDDDVTIAGAAGQATMSLNSDSAERAEETEDIRDEEYPEERYEDDDAYPGDESREDRYEEDGAYPEEENNEEECYEDADDYPEEESVNPDEEYGERESYRARSAEDLEREAYERGDEPEYDEEYEDYRDDEDYDYDYDDRRGGYDSYEDEESFIARFFGAIRDSSGVEKAAAIVAVILLAGAIGTFSFYSKAMSKTKEIGSFTDVGTSFTVSETVGQSGLIAIADAEKAKAMAAALIQNNGEDPGAGLEFLEDQENAEGVEEEKNVTVKVSLTSVKSDMKIKFTNASTGKLVSNVHFEVTVVNPDGTSITYDDHDMDGIIYKSKLTSGTYKITPVPLSAEYADYTMDTATQSLTIKDTVSMKKVDVSNEIKKESQVNAAVEDTQVETVVESQLKDTVEYVESTKVAEEKPAKTDSAQTAAAQTESTKTEETKTEETKTEQTKTEETKTESTSSTTTTQGTVEGEGEFEFQEIDKSQVVDPTLSGKLEISGKNALSASNTEVYEAKTAMAGNILVARTGMLAAVTDEQQLQLLLEQYAQQQAVAGETREQIQLSTTNITLDVGGYTQITATAPGNVSFSSEDESIVQVAGNGTVVGIAEGTTAVRVSCDGCEDAGVVVTVKKASANTSTSTQDATFSCSTKSLTLKVGEVGKINASSNQTINYQSGDENIAVVTADGQVGGAKEGKTKVIVYVDNAHYAEVEVKVVNANQSNMSLNTTSLKMAVGTMDFIAVTGPKSATFTSSNELVAMVDENGQVAAMSEGTANITITADGYNDAVVKVTVVKKTDKDIKVKSTELITSKGRTVKIELEDSTIKAKFSSGNTSVATVSADGTIKGVGVGIAQIIVSADGYNDAKVGVKIIDNAIQLKDNDGNTVYVKNADGTYRIATVDDYFSGVKFYTKKSSTSSNTNYKYTGWQTIDGKTYYYDKNGNPVTGEQVIQGAKYVFDSNGVLSTQSGTMGIDVSKWNGNIDWDKVKNSGVQFVIIRCGYRGSSEGALIEDPKFRTNIEGALNAGLKVGVYFFTQAVDEVEAVEEASMVLELISGYTISFPIYLDVEASNGRGDNISVSQRTANIKAFCGTIQDSGYRAGVYANKTWLNEKINITSLTNYKIWLAQYAASVTYTKTRYDMWQYTSKGQVPGITGDVDMDILYNN